MKILIVGDSSAGSFQMRGIQLGEAMGARVTLSPTVDDWDWCERIVLVKRAGLKWATMARACGVPIVWDALDFWKQPADNLLTERAAQELLAGVVEYIRPHLVIGATLEMAEAVPAGYPAAYLPHHARLGLAPTPARDAIKTVAYDGEPRYLDYWLSPLQTLCQQRGWRFVIRPANLADADILVAFRGGVWDGWMCRRWKSGVKISNAIMAGRPILTQSSAAGSEINPYASFLEDPQALSSAFEQWIPYDIRQHVALECLELAKHYTVDALAARYRVLIEGAGCTATVHTRRTPTATI